VAPTSWLLALIPVMFTYSGWNAAGYIAEEIRNPGRNVPRSFAIGTAAVVLLYLAMNVLYLYVFPIDQLAKVQGSVLDLVADRLLGAAAGDVMAVVALISLSASISAMTFAGPRVYFAMARDGLFFRRLAVVHPRYRTPALAIVAQAAWSSVLVLFVLRAREPHAERPFRALGYPVAPAIYVIASALILLNGLWRDPGPTGAGAIIIALGIPVYFWFRRRA
jgi:APA family basic amino acid/polyamine antiporter